ncbi:MAG: carbohydrate ABC transporter permease, partial [Oscillospiraceae bacterium]
MKLKKRKNNMNRISSASNAIFNFIFIVYSFLCVYPVALVVGTSFSEENYLKEVGYRVFPQVVSFDAYA